MDLVISLVLPEICLGCFNVLWDFSSPQEGYSQPNHTNMKCFGLRSRITRISLNWYLKWIWSKWGIASPWHMLVSTTCFYSVEINVCGECQHTAAAVHVYLLLWWQNDKMKKSGCESFLSSCCAYLAEIKSILLVLKTNIFDSKCGAFWMY